MHRAVRPAFGPWPAARSLPCASPQSDRPRISTDRLLNRMPWRATVLLSTGLALLAPQNAWAAPVLDGSTLRWPWALPFIGILLTIAGGPLLFPKIWHAHYGKLAFVWGTLTVAPLAAVFGVPIAAGAFVHAMLAEYLSFIVLLFALYVVAGGILLTGHLRGTPVTNTAILTFGTLIASVVGTTGAAMIPPGAPPLFVGFLRGVDFFWTTRNLWQQTALVAGLVLAAFVALDL